MRGRMLGMAALAMLASAGVLSAQSRYTWMASGGLSVPNGEFDQYATTGWAASVGVERALRSQPISFRFDVLVAYNTHDDVPDFKDATTLTGANVSFVYRVSSRTLHFYVLAGVGYLHDHFSTTDPDDNSVGTGAQFALLEGAGLAIGHGPTQVFVEGRYEFGLITAGIHFMPITAGLRFTPK